MKTLHLTLKKEWFDMILSGEKTEEYREIKEFWWKRLVNGYKFLRRDQMPKDAFKNYDKVCFRNGYGNNVPEMIVEFKGIDFGMSKPEWADVEDMVFIIKLGKILETRNTTTPNN